VAAVSDHGAVQPEADRGHRPLQPSGEPAAQPGAPGTTQVEPSEAVLHRAARSVAVKVCDTYCQAWLPGLSAFMYIVFSSHDFFVAYCESRSGFLMHCPNSCDPPSDIRSVWHIQAR
jgi:hypothetical protein